MNRNPRPITKNSPSPNVNSTKHEKACSTYSHFKVSLPFLNWQRSNPLFLLFPKCHTLVTNCVTEVSTWLLCGNLKCNMTKIDLFHLLYSDLDHRPYHLGFLKLETWLPFLTSSFMFYSSLTQSKHLTNPSNTPEKHLLQLASPLLYHWHHFSIGHHHLRLNSCCLSLVNHTSYCSQYPWNIIIIPILKLRK